MSNKNKGLKTISLFSGCGGFDLGVARAGHKIIWANDNSKAAAETYKINFPETEFVFTDIRYVNRFPQADMVVGCYPCQGFSEGGRRKNNDHQNYLYREFARCIRLIRPKFFVAENVAGMAKLFRGSFLKNQLRTFRLLGYRVKWALLDGANYGIPQERKRIFLVGVRSDIAFNYQFPVPTHGPGRKPYITLRQAIWDMPRWPKGEYWDESFHWYYLSRNRRRGWDEISLCILANRRHVPLHPMGRPLTRIGPDKWALAPDSKYRRLSFRECAAIQTFPKSFLFPDSLSLSQKYWVIGNAVPPILAEKLLEGLERNGTK